MKEFRDEVESLFGDSQILEHKSPDMQTLSAKLLALGFAELSNLIRGAAFYRYRKGEDSLDGYAPRRIAADTIDEVTAEQNK